jgi:hypothetical protein
MTEVQTSPFLKRRLARVLFALLMAIALLAALAWSVGAFAYRTNLSSTSTMVSARPDVAVSDDGEYVAASWADFNTVVGSTDGKVRLKRSPVSGSPFWAEHKAVFDPDASTGNGLEAKLTYDPSGNYVHVVWLWGASNVPTQLRYSKCDVTVSGMAKNCNPNGQTVRSVSSGQVVQPDIAVDDNGTVHFAWIETSTSAVRYRSRTGSGTWSSIQDIDSPGSAPSIAFAKDGSTRYLHLAWVDDASDEIQYRRGQISGGTTTWGTARAFAGGSLGTAGSPSVDASGSKVVLVWDAVIGSGDYAVAYNYSSDNGTTWQLSGAEWRVVPTGDYLTPFPDRVKRPSSEAGTYKKRLQPDVTLEIAATQTLVHVVWHEYVSPAGEGSERYDVYYSSADFSKLEAGSCSGDCWVAPTNVTSDTKDLEAGVSSASAAIAVGGGFTHTVYMEEIGSAWDTIYNGDLDAGGSAVFLPVVLKDYQ